MPRLLAALVALAALLPLASRLRADGPSGSPATRPAPAATAPAPQNLTPLAERQDRLTGNVTVLEQQLPLREDLKGISANLRSAAGSMTGATAALYHNDRPAALPAQSNALGSLDAAIAELQARLRTAHTSLDGLQLADLIREYQTMKTSQQDINIHTSYLIAPAPAATAPAAPPALRPELQFATIARRQAALADEIASLNSDLAPANVPVLLVINAQVVRHMTASARGLAHAETGPLVTRAQEHALARLDDIIAALMDEQARRSNFRHEDTTPPSPINAPRPPTVLPPARLIPDLAQLKLLKALQVALNADTASAQKRMDSAATSEAERDALYGEIQSLSRQQSQIRDLAKHFPPPTPAPED